MPSTSVIIDLETLGRTPGSVITEIGMLAFNRSDLVTVGQVSIHLDFLAQMEVRRSVDPATIAWRRKNRCLPPLGTCLPAAAVRQVDDFIRHHQPVNVWMQGPQFDEPLLADFWTQNGQDSLPWKYWAVQDSRSLWKLAFPGTRHAPRPHQALADCRATLADMAASFLALKLDPAAVA